MTQLVFAPDAIVRFESGRSRIDAAAATMPPFITDNPSLIGWLAHFAAPRDDAQALAQLPEPSRELAARALAYLRESGALVATDLPNPTDDEATHAHSRQLLTALTQDLYELACDVSGLGPHAQGALVQRSGLGLNTRLRALRGAVGALRDELAALRAPYLSQQLQALGVQPDARELKLHIGCGPCHLTGWINLDVHPAPLATNVLWGLPFADGSVRVIFLSHLLEHLFYPNDVYPFLQELMRVLAPGGTVRIVVPDIEQCIEAYQQRDAAFFAGRTRHWGGGEGDPTRLEDFLAYAGAGPDPAWLFEAHKFGYDFETLQRALQRSGFVEVVRSGYMRSAVGDLQVDDHSEVASARYGERYYSLFVEARKPSLDPIA